MEAIYIAAIIAVICISIASIAGFTLIALSLRSYFTLKREELEVQREGNRLMALNDHSSLKYSEDLLDLIRNIVDQVAVMKFKNFTDTHDIEKVNIPPVKGLVEDVATDVHNALILDNVKFNEAIFTEAFLNQYIIDVAMIAVKQLLSKYVDEYDGQ